MKVKKNNKFEELRTEEGLKKLRRALSSQGGKIEHNGKTYIVKKLKKK